LPPQDDYDDTSQRASSVTDSLLNDYNKDTLKLGSCRITANNDKSRTNDTEYFLLGVSDLLRLPPKVEAPSVQCHLINYGEGLNTLITFHTLESSSKQDVSTSDPHAFFRENGHNTGSGIVGKLLCGVEKMLLECMKKEGIGHGADLAASSVSLLSAVTHAVQGFSSSSLTTLSAWMDALGKLSSNKLLTIINTRYTITICKLLYLTDCDIYCISSINDNIRYCMQEMIWIV
jgi:hypothetical protein